MLPVLSVEPAIVIIKVLLLFIEAQLVQAVSINCLVIIAPGIPDGEKAMIRLPITITEKNFHSKPSITGAFLLL
nr:MAG TPA: hypothetical protein [Caudoviricetes sp.]